MQFWSHHIVSYTKGDRSEKLPHKKLLEILMLQLIFTIKPAKKAVPES